MGQRRQHRNENMIRNEAQRKKDRSQHNQAANKFSEMKKQAPPRGSVQVRILRTFHKRLVLLTANFRAIKPFCAPHTALTAHWFAALPAPADGFQARVIYTSNRLRTNHISIPHLLLSQNKSYQGHCPQPGFEAVLCTLSTDYYNIF